MPGSVTRDSSRRPDLRRSLLSNRDMMVRRGHHITGPRGARDAPSDATRGRARCEGGIARRSTSDRRPPSEAGPGRCPNLLQRPPSRRSTGRETLIFRASSRGRSRRGAPLQQIWTDRRPGQSHAPHASHSSGGFRPVWSSEPGRVARRTVGGPARFPVMALREDRSGGPIGCARGFPHDCAVVTAARSGAERNDPPRAPFSASDGSGPGSTREPGQRHGRARGEAPARGEDAGAAAGAGGRGRARDQDRRAHSGEHRRPATTLAA